MTVRIVTDSACDLPDELLDEYGITVVPLSIRFGSEELIDREQLSVGEFWQRCAASEVLPETAAPAPGQFETAYRRLASEGASAVVVVSLSGALSATIQSAELAARGVADEIDVRIVDSRSVTLGLGTMVLAAARAASTGATADAIVELVGDMSARTKVFGALDTLDNLKKGGRMPRDAGMFPARTPVRPTNYQLQEIGRRFPPNHLHETWMDYLYWDVELDH